MKPSAPETNTFTGFLLPCLSRIDELTDPATSGQNVIAPSLEARLIDEKLSEEEVAA